MHVGEWDGHDVSTVRSCFNFNGPHCTPGRRGAWSEYRLLPADLEEAGGWDLHQLDRHHITLTVQCRNHVPGFRMFESRTVRLDHFGSDGSLKVIFVHYKLSKKKNSFSLKKKNYHCTSHESI